MKAASINCHLLSDLVVSPKFVKSLKQLGDNAQKQRESRFGVCLQGEGLEFSRIISGGVTFVSKIGESWPGQTIVDVHNHPRIGFKYFDFFSPADLSGLDDGVIRGLVSCPNDFFLILLLAQIKSPEKAGTYNLNWYEESLSSMLLEYQETRKGGKLAQSWMEATVRGLSETGINAASMLYVYDEAEPAVSPLYKHGDFEAFTISREFLAKIEEHWAKQPETVFSSEEAARCKPEDEEKKSLMSRIFPYQNAKRLGHLEFLQNKKPKLISILGALIDIGYLARMELARQMVEKGLVTAEPVYSDEIAPKNDPSFATYLLEEEERDRLKDLRLFTLADLKIIAGIPIQEIRDMVDRGWLIPDFTVEDKGKQVPIFVGNPEIDMASHLKPEIALKLLKELL